jgi:hypothetical protein
LVFCVTVRESDSKIFVTDRQPAFTGATREVNTAAAAAIVSPIFLIALSCEKGSPYDEIACGKDSAIVPTPLEAGHSGSRFVDNRERAAIWLSAGASAATRSPLPHL